VLLQNTFYNILYVVCLMVFLYNVVYLQKILKKRFVIENMNIY